MSNVANVTAIIATLDRPDALARCLDALLSGDVLPAEVIIVDQSQTDATRSVIAQRNDRRVEIIYVWKQPPNASASRNVAINRARCPVVAVTDDDCMSDRGWIAAIERTFASPTAPDAMTGRVLALGPDEPGLYAASLRRSMKRAEFTGKVVPWIVGTGGNFAVKHEWFNRVGGYDERLGPGSPGKAAEDMDLLYRLLRAGARIQYEPDALIYHERQNKSRRMASRWSYGYGTGAFCGIWLCRGDLFALQIIGYWLRDQCRLLADAIGRRQWLQVYQRSLSLRGTVRGFVYGLRVN
jgi:glycosyltransferase involved in cell wall biosynthesis